jgi:hypothetical protein
METENSVDNLIERLFPERYPRYLLSKTTWTRILEAKNKYSHGSFPNAKHHIVLLMKKDLDNLHTPLYNDNEKRYLRNKASALVRSKRMTNQEAEMVWQEECCKTVRELRL